MPIGELWDLEGLAAECELQKRWSFFLSSAPLNVPGGIASPPNVLAIFGDSRPMNVIGRGLHRGNAERGY